MATTRGGPACVTSVMSAHTLLPTKRGEMLVASREPVDEDVCMRETTLIGIHTVGVASPRNQTRRRHKKCGRARRKRTLTQRRRRPPITVRQTTPNSPTTGSPTCPRIPRSQRWPGSRKCADTSDTTTGSSKPVWVSTASSKNLNEFSPPTSDAAPAANNERQPNRVL